LESRARPEGNDTGPGTELAASRTIVERKPFKVSTGLKDLIGRQLITNDFVAVFELVKNSFDAYADTVQIYFDNDRIIIADNGKGMSRDDILDKWLFVAYSAKREGTEDENYRDKIAKHKRPFAGAKGIGRFSCDRLGRRLSLSSRSGKHAAQHLDIDWTLYEKDFKQEFREVEVDIGETEKLPSYEAILDAETGTILEITLLRSEWDDEKFIRLRRELAKLINPFLEEKDRFRILLKIKGKKNLSGEIRNEILDVLKQKTTSIRVEFNENGAAIQTLLRDRGDLIYRIKEKNTFKKLSNSYFISEIFFLNRGAKKLFTHRMGIRSVAFGSVFLFRNGFRVFPIGEEHDDFFGLQRRKQQGQRRFLGSRDVIGHVQIKGGDGFEEATSRDQGLIGTPQVEELIECVLAKCIRRLERYVVDITWKDVFDKDVQNTSRMMRDESSALIGNLVSRLAAAKGVELIEYNPNLVRIVDEKSAAFETSLKALELLAEKTGDKAILTRVKEASKRMKALQEAEADAREAGRRAEQKAVVAEQGRAVAESRYGEERKRNEFLVAAASLDKDTILNLHHQIIMQASDVHVGVRRMMGKLRKGATVAKEEWIDFLEQMSFRNSQILTAARFATKGGYRQQSTKVEGDLVAYMRDYIETVSSLWAPQGISVKSGGDGKPLPRSFRPIEIGIVIDNLVSNAAKARATKIGFTFSVGKGPKPELAIHVTDDGEGWRQPSDSIGRVFEKGVTTTDGSGLGLHHVKQVVEGLGGLIEAHREPYSDAFPGAHIVLRIPT